MKNTQLKKDSWGIGIVVQGVKLPLEVPTSHTAVSVRVLASPLPVWLPVNVPGKVADDGPSAWAPATHVGNLDEVPDFCLWPGPVLATGGIWGVNG